MMNDITWVEAGIAIANSLLAVPKDEKRLSNAFFRICSRKPRPEELTILNRALERARKDFNATPKSAEAYLSQGFFKPNRKTTELAALAAVCTAIFNLDEAVTKG
jgi:hypothetical protein